MIRNPEITKQLVLEKSALLFNRRGYAGATMKQLTDEIGMTKGSIYGNFLNKHELFIEAFRFNFQQLIKRIRIYVAEETSPVRKLLAITRFYREDFDVMSYLGGCPLMNAATDADDTNEALKEEVINAFQGILMTMTGFIEEGKKNREIKNSVESSKYATLFFSLIEGGILISKTTGNKKYLMETCDRIDKIINEELKK